jgi:AraC-like DNA-binding protein
MKELRSELVAAIELFSPAEGMHESPVPGAYCIKVSRNDRRTKRRWRACLAIVAQGCKEIVLGREVYRCEDAHYTASPIDLPVVSGIALASPAKPFLCLLIDFDPLTLSEVAAQLEKGLSKETEDRLRAVFVGKASDKMLDAAIRLARLFQTPEDAPVLGPLVIKEMLYHLLKGPDGPAIHQFVLSGSKTHRVSRAIYTLNSELGEDLDVRALARAANMSRSAFFKHFKEVTALSHLQYQKRLRLLEARRLMVEEGETAESSAYKVGYQSASQFSREYSRMFGNSPLRDAIRIKETGNPIYQYV